MTDETLIEWFENLSNDIGQFRLEVTKELAEVNQHLARIDATMLRQRVAKLEGKS